MARRSLRLRTRAAVREMFGRVQPRPGRFGTFTKMWNAFFGNRYKDTLDLTKNDYALFLALYHGSTMPAGGSPAGDSQGNVGKEFLLAAGLSKPIIKSAAAFALGGGYVTELPGSDTAEPIKDSEAKLNAWVTDNFHIIYDWVKWAYRDGDSYLMVTETGELDQLAPETVTVITDPVSGELIGYNVEEQVTEINERTQQEEHFTYLKQYRHNLTRYTRIPANEDADKGQIIYERVYANGQSIDTQLTDEAGNPVNQVEFLPEELDKRPLPIVHFKNEPEAKHAYGFSDLQNVLVAFRNYTAVLEGGTKREIYNNAPILKMLGVDKPEDTDPNVEQQDTQTIPGVPEGEQPSDNKAVAWDQDKILYIADPNGDASFIQVSSSMSDTKDLLAIYFYLVVQASETPEFLFGGAVSSSRASVETQMPVVVKKAEGKRRQMKGHLSQLMDLHIYRQLELSNPDYFAVQGLKLDFKIDFPPIVDTDMKLNVEMVRMCVQEGIMSGETALEMVAGDRIKDAKAEIAKAQAEVASAERANQRLIDEAGNGDPAATA